MSLFRCPLCAAPLERSGGAYRCPAGHRFDVAREGYVHLLPPNQKHSALPGDDREMVLARREFLSKEYYYPLLNTICNCIVSIAGETPAVLDAGCGEGYYTAGVCQALRAAGKRPRAAGTDISKFALRSAARRERNAEFAVASSYHLPLEEFRRVLRPGGWFFYVVPGPEHLWEMKEILYDAPYPNEEKETPYPGFAYREILPVESVLRLEDPADIRNLFRMTPYFWKTPRAGAERLEALNRLEVRASFRVHVFQKEAAS